MVLKTFFGEKWTSCLSEVLPAATVSFLPVCRLFSHFLFSSPAGIDVIGCLFCLWGGDERCCSLLPSRLHLDSDVRQMKPSSYLRACACVCVSDSLLGFFVFVLKKTDFYDFYRGCCCILESWGHIFTSTMFSPCWGTTQRLLGAIP